MSEQKVKVIVFNELDVGFYTILTREGNIPVYDKLVRDAETIFEPNDFYISALLACLLATIPQATF